MAQITQLSVICIPGRLHTFTAKIPAEEEVVIDLTKDVWTQVLSNVTSIGKVFIIDLDLEPTGYLVALVDAGDAPPASSFEGGIKFHESFSPANNVLSDYYVMPLNRDGKVAVLL